MSDNSESWNQISAEYQAGRGWPTESLAWGIRCPLENELRVLDEVRDKRVVVLGCGGGQDCMAISHLGPAYIAGVDASEAQIQHARRLLGCKVHLVHHEIETLPMFEDGAFDVVVSVHVLSYVREVAAVLREAWRVLKPGGQLAFSVHHPVDAVTTDDPPYCFTQSYFQVETEWSWFGGTPFRSWHRPLTEWFRLVREAGFEVERMLEPPPVDLEVWRRSGWNAEPYYSKLNTVPGTLIVSARRR